MNETAVVIDGISTGVAIGLFLLGGLIGGFTGWVLGVFQAHAELGVPISDRERVSGRVSITLPDSPSAGPRPKAER